MLRLYFRHDLLKILFTFTWVKMVDQGASWSMINHSSFQIFIQSNTLILGPTDMEFLGQIRILILGSRKIPISDISDDNIFILYPLNILKHL